MHWKRVDEGAVESPLEVSSEGGPDGPRRRSAPAARTAGDVGVLEQARYTGRGDDSLMGVVDRGGGYVLCGTVSEPGERNSGNHWAIDVSSDGSVNWEQTYPADGGADLLRGAAGPVGGYTALVGTRTSYVDGSYSYEGVVRLVSATGTAVSTELVDGGSAETFLQDVVATDDGFAAVGLTVDSDDRKGLLVELDDDGDVRWEETYEGGDGSQLLAVDRAHGGGYAMVGATEVEPYTGWFLEVDARGSVQVSNELTRRGDENCNAVTRASDGGYVVVGSSRDPDRSGDNLWWVKLDGDGRQEWVHSVAMGNDGNPAAVVRDGGGFVASAKTGHPPDGEASEAMVSAVDAGGDERFTDVVDGPGSGGFGDLVQSADGFVAAGRTDMQNVGTVDQTSKGWFVEFETPNEGPSAAFDVSPPSPRVGTTVLLDAQDSGDPDGSVVRYRWDVDDDGTYEKEGEQVSHVFEAAGEHEVTLEVTDAAGSTATASRTVSVAGPTATATRARTVTRTRTQTPEEVPYDLRDGDATEVQLGDRDLLVVENIPGAGDSVAVTDRDYQLVDVTTTRDALYTYTWMQAGGWARDWSDEVWKTERLREESHNDELFGRAVDFGWDVTAIVTAVAAGYAPAAIGPAVDVATEGITWAVEEENEPYKQAFERMTASLSAARAVQERTDTVVSTGDFDRYLEEFVGNAYTVYEAGTSSVQFFDDFVSAMASGSGYTASAGSALSSSTVTTFFVGFALDFTVDTIEGPVKTKTQIHAVQNAYATVRLPVVERLRALHQAVVDGTASPAEVVEYHMLLFTDYQMGAMVFEASSELWQEISDSTTGSVWDIIANADGKADQLARTAETLTETAKTTMWVFGAGLDDVERSTTGSVNAEVLER
jgi:PKD repeat protein